MGTNEKEIIIDGCNVAKCDRHCTDNYNNPNMCYSDITEDYRNCKPKEYQCCFYVENIEKQLQHLKVFLEWLIKQQYYILHKNLKAKIKGILNE